MCTLTHGSPQGKQANHRRLTNVIHGAHQRQQCVNSAQLNESEQLKQMLLNLIWKTVSLLLCWGFIEISSPLFYEQAGGVAV